MKYRPEIDGLRAVAVIPVVLFHASLGCPGGFVGVDVFFVVSGYLICRMIVCDSEAGRFSFLQFWSRRVRRILPALVTTTLGTMSLAWLVSMPASLNELGASAKWLCAMASNFFFCDRDGYFGARAETLPLLHTWSLSLEEQFYLFSPILFSFVSRIGRTWMIRLLLSITCASLLLSVIFEGSGRSESFFLLPSRAWELLVGSVLAILPRRAESLSANRPSWLHEAGSCIGLVAILIPCWRYRAGMPYPGLPTIPVVLGAAAFVFFTEERKTYAARLLSTRPLRFIGQISYSLYLWHWPIFALTNDIGYEIDKMQAAILVGVSLIFAVTQWRCIEQPFRESYADASHKTVLLAGASALGIVFLCGFALYRADSPGLVGKRLTDELLMHGRWTGSDRQLVVDSSGDVASLRCVGTPPHASRDTHRVLLWGDSHAMAASETFNRLGKEHNTTVFLAMQSATIPVPGMFLRSQVAAISSTHSQLLQQVVDLRINDVVLIASWRLYCLWNGGLADATRSDELRGSRLHVDSDASEVSEQASIDSLKRQLLSLHSRLSKYGVRVWVVLEIPQTNHPSVASAFARHIAYPLLYPPPKQQATKGEFLERQGQLRMAIESVSREGLRVLDSAQFAFDERGRLRHVVDGQPTYRDTGHVTRPGAEAFIAPVVRKIFENSESEEASHP